GQRGAAPYSPDRVEIVDDGGDEAATEHGAGDKGAAPAPGAGAGHAAKPDGEAHAAVAKARSSNVESTVDRVDPSNRASLDGTHGALAKASVSVASGAAPSQALDPTDYGLTFPESVDVKISAK